MSFSLCRHGRSSGLPPCDLQLIILRTFIEPETEYLLCAYPFSCDTHFGHSPPATEYYY